MQTREVSFYLKVLQRFAGHNQGQHEQNQRKTSLDYAENKGGRPGIVQDLGRS